MNPHPSVLSGLHHDIGIEPGFDPLGEENLRSILPKQEFIVKSTKFKFEKTGGIDVVAMLPGWAGECDNTGGKIEGCKGHSDETVHSVAYHCNDPKCSRCSSYWGYKRAIAVNERLKACASLYQKAGVNLGRIKEWVFSPPQEYAKEKLRTVQGTRELRSEVTKLAKSAGVKGGTPILHEHRKKHLDGSSCEWKSNCHQKHFWKYSPHYHIIGWGYLENSREFHKRTNWVYKNLGKRKSVIATVEYLLTHATLVYYRGLVGERKPFNVVTYFGIVSCNKVSKCNVLTDIITKKCPVKDCGEDLYTGYLMEAGDIVWDDVSWYKRKRWLYKLKYHDQVYEQFKDEIDKG